ncbi:MAG: efflux RND transporter periplasmic adaptor subunit [bacterium]|jgi:RND family efflux transporter MFP subunit
MSHLKMHLKCAFCLLILIGASLPPSAVAYEESIIRGPLRPVRLVALGPQNEGIVNVLRVSEGSIVTAGTVILELNDDVAQARVGLARAAANAEGDLRQARLHHQEAQEVLARTQQASTRGAATEWEVRQARVRVEITKAVVESAEERRSVENQRLNLELAQASLSLIRAPFDGMITRVDTVVGAFVTRGDRPITVADLKVLEAVLFLPAELWFRLRVGNSYSLSLSEPIGRKTEGLLRHMDPVMDAASGRFRAVFTINNADLQIPAGLDAGLDLEEVPP